LLIEILHFVFILQDNAAELCKLFFCLIFNTFIFCGEMTEVSQLNFFTFWTSHKSNFCVQHCATLWNNHSRRRLALNYTKICLPLSGCNATWEELQTKTEYKVKGRTQFYYDPIIISEYKARRRRWGLISCLHLHKEIKCMLFWYSVMKHTLFEEELIQCSRSRWARGLRYLRLRWVRIPPWAYTSVSRECCVLSGRILCNGPITRPEESYRMWCVWVWSRNLNSDGVLAHQCCRAMKKIIGRWIMFQR
jgi:hypothetical protein